MATFAVLGLGEAGALYASQLAEAGQQVAAYDPAGVTTPARVRRCATAEEAVTGADLVLSLTGAGAAVEAAASARAAMGPGAVYADLNTTAPQVKRQVHAALAGSGALVADVAVLAPVPRAELRTPLMASGPGARPFAESVRHLGVPIEILDADIGSAAGRKLLRSVFMKGLAAAALEAVTAGESAGCGEWIRQQIACELAAAGPDLLDRLLTGSRRHAARRAGEMAAAHDYLTELGTPTAVTAAALSWLRDLRAPAEEESHAG